MMRRTPLPFRSSALQIVARETARLWREHRLSDDQTRPVVEAGAPRTWAPGSSGMAAHPGPPRPRQVERLIEHAYRHSFRYRLTRGMLF